LGTCCVSCFLLKSQRFEAYALRKAAFSAILRCWVKYLRPVSPMKDGEAPLELKPIMF
jgi:hypothetical protein